MKRQSKELNRNEEITQQYFTLLDSHLSDLVSGRATEMLEINQIADVLCISPKHLSETISLTMGHHPCHFYDHNTVGRVLKKPFGETTEAEYDGMFDINSKVAYFFIQEAGKQLNNNGKICTIVTSLLAAFTGLYSTYAGAKAPVEDFTRAASKEFGSRGISVTAVGPGPMDTPFFYGQESPEAVAYHKSASDLGGLTKIEDIVPLIEFLVTEGWWITGQTIFANGGYTTR